MPEKQEKKKRIEIKLYIEIITNNHFREKEKL